MKKLRFKSLTLRIWTTFTAIILIIICSISVLYLVAFRRINESSKIQDLKVAHDVLLNGDNFNQQNRFNELKNLRGSDHFIAKIVGKKKTEIIGIEKKKDGTPRNGKGFTPQQKFNDDEIKKWMTSFITDDNVYEKQFNESFKGMKFIFIVSSIEDDKAEKCYLVSYIPNVEDSDLLNMVLVIGVMFIAVGFIIAKVVANYISKPLKELEAYTMRIAKKDWREPIEIENHDEIGRLVNSMNYMQKELQKAEEEEKMFLQSISHDLKTPVMVIMSHAEAIVDGVYIESVEKTAEIIRDEAISLEKKIKQLLYLNTLSYVLENNNENTEIDFQDLLLHTINRFELVNSKIEWDLNINKAFITGSTEKIQVAIENIIDNALRYAKEKISITLTQESSFVVLEIYNDGPNIKQENLERIFQNLYKDKTGNFGLGLAISKKIIDFYNGEIKAINKDKGVSFIIKYPIN